MSSKKRHPKKSQEGKGWPGHVAQVQLPSTKEDWCLDLIINPVTLWLTCPLGTSITRDACDSYRVT